MIKQTRGENEQQDNEAIVHLLKRLRDQNAALKNLIMRLEERNIPESSSTNYPDKHEK